MKLTYLILSVIIAQFILNSPLLAQEKWGKISKEILNMTQFEPDTTADAVILFDIAEEQISEDFIITLKSRCKNTLLS